GPTLLDGAREQRHGGRAQRLAEDIRHDTRARVDGCRGVSQRAPQLRRLTDEVRRGEQLAGDAEVDAGGGVQGRPRRRERLSGRAAHYFDAFSASRSARKRSTTAFARWSSESVSPITPPARSRASVPTSLRRDTSVA